MKREYRQVIQNIKLAKEEAQTLYDAEKILKEALDIMIQSFAMYCQKNID